MPGSPVTSNTELSAAAVSLLRCQVAQGFVGGPWCSGSMDKSACFCVARTISQAHKIGVNFLPVSRPGDLSATGIPDCQCHKVKRCSFHTCKDFTSSPTKL
eukprot:1148803-Amphidinium_carterae.1